MSSSSLHERLVAAAGSRTFRHIAELTRQNPETVRRYMHGQAPSAEFLAAFCTALGISAQWLLLGRGPMRDADVRKHALGEATPADLLSAMAQTLEKLADRVDRLEVITAAVETRVRVQIADRLAGGTNEKPSNAAGPVVVRARRIADALAERPSQDADGTAPPGDP